MKSFSAQGQILIAMPGLHGDFFDRSIIVMCEHDEKGALGFALNKRSEFSLLTLFRDLDLPAEPELGKVNAFLGGPVDTQRGFILSEVELGDCNEPIDGLFINSHSQDLPKYTQLLIQGRAIFVLGYSGWGESQLADEMAENAWLTAPWRKDLAFDIEIESRHQVAIESLGFDVHQLSQQIGHA